MSSMLSAPLSLHRHPGCTELRRTLADQSQLQRGALGLTGSSGAWGQDRHARADGQLLRYADGRPITSRRYDHS